VNPGFADIRRAAGEAFARWHLHRPIANKENGMTTTTKPQSTQSFSNTAGCGACVPFNSINEPGCYVCNWSGHLLRVPEDGVAAGRSPLICIVGCDPLFVTKISNNPYLPVTMARLVAANFDTCVNF
jgi:hypothetical protein